MGLGNPRVPPQEQPLESNSPLDLSPVWLTVRLALVSTLVLLVISVPLAWWLALRSSRLRNVVSAVVALPIVLPPTVLGFYLLVLLGPQGFIGGTWEALGGPRLVFSFGGLVVGSVVYSLPFVVQPIVQAFRAVDRRVLEAASTLGASPLDRFFTVTLPIARPGLIAATSLGFAHTLGEFGVVLMIGGNIPGATRVLSIAIYDQVEALNYSNAHVLSAGLVGFSFLLLLAVSRLQRSSILTP